MLDPGVGTFDYVVAMDSVIHYRAPEMIGVLRALTARARRAVLFTVAPRTPLLGAMHVIGRAFPRGSRAPAIEPIREQELRDGVRAFSGDGWALARTSRISGGFYTSQAWELCRASGMEDRQ